MSARDELDQIRQRAESMDELARMSGLPLTRAEKDRSRLVAALTAALDLRLALDDPIRRESKDMETGYYAALTDIRAAITDHLRSDRD